MSRSAPGSAIPLAQRVQVRARFHRSVHLARDWLAPHDPRDYLATPALLGIARQILEELARSGGARAWTLTGPYGTGKSAFALFLTELLATARPEHPQASELRERWLHGAPPLLPVLIQAERAPLLPAILNALLASGAAKRTLAGRARRLLKTSAKEGAAGAELLSEAAAGARGGLVLIVDELGKYLEYAAREQDEDIFLLQQVAEAAARSKTPLLFIGVLHSGFGDYVAEGDRTRRIEWQKVQGRFHDLPLSLPDEQFLDLAGRALETDLGGAYERRFARVASEPGLRSVLSERSGLRERLVRCLPLHPVAALVLWPLFRSKVAQNERSLFAFLGSHEPHGLQDFLARQNLSARRAPLFGLPELYDYVSTALGMAVLAGRDSRQWSLIGHALERMPAGAPPLAGGLVKSIGLLALYGGAMGLRPGRAVLDAVFDDLDTADLDEALQFLVDESIVVFRRHRRAYGLWEGSDVDLDAAFEAARAQGGGEALHKRVQRAGRPRPLAARAHCIKTGTLRFFEARLASAAPDSLEHALDDAGQADGILLFLLDASLDVNALDERAREISRAFDAARPVLVAAPRTSVKRSTNSNAGSGYGRTYPNCRAIRWRDRKSKRVPPPPGAASSAGQDAPSACSATCSTPRHRGGSSGDGSARLIRSVRASCRACSRGSATRSTHGRPDCTTSC